MNRRDFITLLGGLWISALNIRIIVGRGEAVVPPLVHPKIGEEGRGRIEVWRTAMGQEPHYDDEGGRAGFWRPS